MEAPIRRRAVLVMGVAGVTAVLSSSASAQESTPILRAYLDAWRGRNLEKIMRCMHPEVHFKGPNVETRGRDAYRASTQRFLSLLQRVDVRAFFSEGDGGMIAYDFVCPAPIGIAPTAELVRIESALIRESEIFFDVRPFEAFARARQPRAAGECDG